MSVRDWDTFVDDMAQKLGDEHVVAVREFWAAVRDVGCLPGVEVTDVDVGFCWSRVGKVLDVRIFPSGLCEWFCRIEAANLIEGTDEEPEPVPTTAILARLLEFFAPGKECA